MKYLKTFFVPAAASLLLLAASCAKEQFAGSADTLADSEYTAVTLTAGFDTSVRTAVDAEGKVSWKAGDIIRYYSESGGAVGSATVGQDCRAQTAPSREKTSAEVLPVRDSPPQAATRKDAF